MKFDERTPCLKSVAVSLLWGLVLFGVGLAPACGDEWPQWLGPQRDSVWRETGIIEKFPPGGPPVRWRTPIGGGYAGPAVAKGRVYVTDRLLKEGAQDPANVFARGNSPSIERVLCLNESDPARRCGSCNICRGTGQSVAAKPGAGR